MWRLLQLADSAFPAGGFAHSAGLEVAVQRGEVAGATAVQAFARAALWQAGAGALPLVRAAGAQPERAREWDARCQAALVSAVARRASQLQGRAWVMAAEGAFGAALGAGWGELRTAVRARETPGHLCVVFGVSAAALGVEAGQAAQLYLHQVLRGVLSAAVRLGQLGPMQAQRLQFELAGDAEAVLRANAERTVDQLASVAPVEELLGALHDRLYSRLFQS